MIGDRPTALLGLARDVAAEACEVLIEAVRRGGHATDSKSSATDLVTDVDRQVEALIIDRLLAARPEDGVLGEEGGGRPSRSGVRWVIDPIDGTTNFVYRIPAFAVSIAAEVQGTTVAGVVAIPGLDECFEATLGGGARCNGDDIAVSGATSLETALIATGFSYQAGTRRQQGRIVAELLPTIRDIRRMGAASVDLCAVACGRVDGYFESGLNAWDYGAGALIATEAGATVSDLWGGPPSPSFVVAASPALARPLRERLVACGAF
ncbi:MAG: inositol monophosphatase family protein [Acidimicrobiales bacterium]